MNTEKKYTRLRETDIHPADLRDRQLFMQQVGICAETLALWHRSGMICVVDNAVGISHHWSITELQIMVTKIRHDYREWLRHRNRLAHRKILVVEDDADLRHLYEFQIQEMREDDWVHCVSDGAEALFSMGAVKPDIIICDLKMPGMDGFHMLDVLADTGYLRDCKKIIITGMQRQVLDKRFTLPDSVSVLTKPVDFDALHATINTAMAPNLLQREKAI